jgi:hypothetical protein
LAKADGEKYTSSAERQTRSDYGRNGTVDWPKQMNKLEYPDEQSIPDPRSPENEVHAYLPPGDRGSDKPKKQPEAYEKNEKR